MTGEPRYLHCEVKTLSGETKKYEFVALEHMEAMEIFHSTIKSIAEAICSVGSIDMGNLAPEHFVGVVKSLEFAKLRYLADHLLRDAVLDGEQLGKDVGKTNYFRGKELEFYLAIGHAIRLNYPEVFLALKGAGDFFVQGIAKALSTVTDPQPSTSGQTGGK